MPKFSWKQWWNSTFPGRRPRQSSALDHMQGDMFAGKKDDAEHLLAQTKRGEPIIAQATPLQEFVQAIPAGAPAAGHGGSHLHAVGDSRRNVDRYLNTEEFCAQLRKEAFDVDECIFEAASWQQRRKVADWFENVIDDIKQTGLVPKPGVFEYTLFTVSTAGAVAGWIAGGPVGSIIGSKSASVAVGVGFGIKEIAEKYVEKMATQEEPIPTFELSQQPVESVLLQPDHDQSQIMQSAVTKFELEQRPTLSFGTRTYSVSSG